MTTPRNLAAALVIAGLLVAAAAAACSVGPLAEGTAARPAAPGGGASPCASVFSADRCDAILTMAAESLGVADDAVTAIEIAPDPTPRTDGILETRSGSAGIGVIARVAGATRDVRLCMGVAMEPACTLEPRLTIHSAIGNGYEDVPCPGEPPAGCATPVPSPDPGAVTAGRPLRIEHVVLPVTSVGHQELRLGTAVLPNGVWTVARAELGDPGPTASTSPARACGSSSAPSCRAGPASRTSTSTGGTRARRRSRSSSCSTSGGWSPARRSRSGTCSWDEAPARRVGCAGERPPPTRAQRPERRRRPRHARPGRTSTTRSTRA